MTDRALNEEARVLVLLPLATRLGRAFALRSGANADHADDCVRDAHYGAFKAARHYCPAYGVPLSAYAVPVIRNNILHGVASRDVVSHKVRQALHLGRAVKENLTHTLMRDATADEVEDVVPGYSAARRRVYERRSLPLETSVIRPRDNDVFVAPTRGLPYAPSAEAIVLQRATRAAIFRALSRLSARDRSFIDRHYFRSVSIRAIAEQENISTQRASQIHLRALRKLRQFLADSPAAAEVA